MEKINLREKYSLFSDFWSPKIIGELNGQFVKLAKFQGEFVWHAHAYEDELFMVIQGTLRLEFRDKTVIVNENEMIIVPKGVEHRPSADEEVWVMLFEPKETLNTGNTRSAFTKENLEWI